MQPISARVAATNSTVICPIDNVTFDLLLSRSQAGQRYIVVSPSSYNSIYEYSLDPPNYSLSNVLTPSVDSGTVFIRMKDRQVCMRRIDFTFPDEPQRGAPSTSGQPTFIAQAQTIAIYATASGICSPSNSVLSLVGLSSDPTLSPDKVEWYRGDTKLEWSASDPALAYITVYQEGNYRAKVYNNSCSYDVPLKQISNNCPTTCTVTDTPTITATSTSLCPSGSTTLNATGCQHATVWYKVTGNSSDFYLSEGNTYTANAAGVYYAKCASVANCDECNNYCEGKASGNIVVTSCQPTCNIAITGLTNGQTVYTACNTGVTLTGMCSGADCTGASATWSNVGGWSSNGLSATTPAQTVNSTIAYTLNITKVGCTKTITAYVSTTGCTTANPCPTPIPPTLVQSETHCAGSFNLAVTGCSTHGYRWRVGSPTGAQVSTGFGYNPTLHN